MLLRSLIEVDDSVLIVIDVQAAFTARLPQHQGESLVRRICWLMGVADRLAVPLVVTAEDVSVLGGVVPQVEKALPPGTDVHNKMVFGLVENPDILEAVARTGRKTAVLVGLETDVCVSHSAIGLMGHGCQVVVVADATGAPGTAHSFGLERIRNAGALVTSSRMIFYEWVRTVDRAKQLRSDWSNDPIPTVKPQLAGRLGGAGRCLPSGRRR